MKRGSGDERELQAGSEDAPPLELQGSPAHLEGGARAQAVGGAVVARLRDVSHKRAAHRQQCIALAVDAYLAQARVL